MKPSLRLGFVACVLGLAAVAGTVVDSVRNPSVGARIAHAAAPVDIELHAGGGFEVIALSTACSENLYPGLICTDQVQIRNVGEIAFAYEIEAWIDVDDTDDGLPGVAGDILVECINVNFDPELADGLDVGDQSAWGPFLAGVIEPGDAVFWGLEVSVDDDNACQGQQGVIFAYVTASADEVTGTPALSDGDGTSGTDDSDAGGGGGGGGAGGGSGAPLPPGSPLDGAGNQFVPPVVGGAGLIGAGREDGAVETWMVVLALVLATAGIACAYGMQVASRTVDRS